MSNLILGKEFAVTLNGVPIMCGRSVTVSESVSIVETTTKGSGKWLSYKGTSNGWEATIDALLINVGSNPFKTLRELKNDFTEVVLAFTGLDVNNIAYNFYGRAIIRLISANGTVGNVASATVELQGTGELSEFPAPYDARFSFVTGGPSVVFTLNWESILGPQYYEVEYSTKTIAPTIITGINTNATVINIAPLDFILFSYRVRSVYLSGTSEWSNYIL